MKITQEKLLQNLQYLVSRLNEEDFHPDTEVECLVDTIPLAEGDKQFFRIVFEYEPEPESEYATEYETLSESIFTQETTQ